MTKQTEKNVKLNDREIDLIALALVLYEDVLDDMAEYGAVKDRSISSEMGVIRTKLRQL